MPDDYLKGLRQELREHIDEYRIIERRAVRSAKVRLYVGFTGVITQLAAMTTGIYYVYDWDTVEPMTFIVSAFWLAVGSSFALYH